MTTSADALTVDIDERLPTRVVMRLEGELTLETADELRTRVAVVRVASPGAELILDMGEVSIVDSTGLRLLRDLSDSEGGFALRSPSGALRRLLHLTLLDATIRVE
jgi:anti-anti-sigma factor